MQEEDPYKAQFTASGKSNQQFATSRNELKKTGELHVLFEEPHKDGSPSPPLVKQKTSNKQSPGESTGKKKKLKKRNTFQKAATMTLDNPSQSIIEDGANSPRTPTAQTPPDRNVNMNQPSSFPPQPSVGQVDSDGKQVNLFENNGDGDSAMKQTVAPTEASAWLSNQNRSQDMGQRDSVLSPPAEELQEQ